MTFTCRVAREEDRAAFNRFVAGSSRADVLQSWEWGEVKRETGWTPIRLFLESDGTPVGTCSVLINRPVRGLPPLAYAPRGPVLAVDDDATLQGFLEQVGPHLQGAFGLICDPPVEMDSEEAAHYQRHMQRVTPKGFGWTQPKAVMVVDLERDLDEILKGFKSKWRYNVRLADRKGVEVREGSYEDLGTFTDLLLETARRDRFAVRQPSYFQALWQHLAPPGYLKLFLAEYQGRPLSAILLFCMGDRAIYTYGASSDEHRNLMPNHLIQWHAMRWAQQAGYRIYDLQGVSPVRDGKPIEDSLAGLNRFKEGFGARYVEYAGQFERPLRGVFYRFWDLAAPTAIRLAQKLRKAAL